MQMYLDVYMYISTDCFTGTGEFPRVVCVPVRASTTHVCCHSNSVMSVQPRAPLGGRSEWGNK